jgi:cell division septation protein DedD
MVLESRHLFGLFVLLAVLFGVVFTLGYLLGRGQGESQARVSAIRAEDSADTAAANPASALATEGDTAAPAAPTGSDWSYYHAGDSKPANDALEPAPSAKPAKPTAKPAANAPAKPTPAPTKPAPAPSKPASKPTASSPAPASTPGSPPPSKPAPATAAAKPAPTPAPATKPAAKPAATSKPSVTVGSPMIPKGAIVLQVAALEKESDALAVAQALQQRKFPAFVLPAVADKYFRVQVGPYANAQAAASAQKQLESAGFKSIVKR